ncbi:MAG: hypothetical protein GY938_16865, partial [Ketobacter sp.]|nr:hypothetical protein [Ketobacter sp.]
MNLKQFAKERGFSVKETAVLFDIWNDPSFRADLVEAGMIHTWQLPPDDLNPAYYPHLDSMHRIQVYYGGSSSGKSVFLAQRCVVDVLTNGRNYLVCRAVARTIRKSVFVEIRKAINTWNLNGRFKINKSEMIITCDNGYQILFAGLDD